MKAMFIATVAARVEYYHHTDGLGYGEDKVCQFKDDVFKCSKVLTYFQLCG